MGMSREKWRDYKKFTIIRNPYDKFISAWKFINKHIKKKELLDLHEYVNKSKPCLKKVEPNLVLKVDKVDQMFGSTFSVEEMKEESAKYLVSEDEFNEKNKGLLERLKVEI